MKLKKYRVSNIKEAMERIKRDLGDDAFILSTKEVVEKGEKWIEVVAAVEKDSVSPPFRTSPDILKVVDRRKDAVEEIKKLFKKFRVSEELEPIKKEIADLKDMLSQTIKKRNSEIDFSGFFYELYEYLIEQDVPSWLAQKFIKMLEYQTPISQHSDREFLKSYLWKILYSAVKIEDKEFLGKKFIAVIGPTGSGKTTTIAKLSAFYYLGEGKKVGLISIDNFRIGAPEQLKTYASILGIPFLLSQDTQQFKEHIEMLKDYDLVFIDTTGRSPSDTHEIKKIGDFLLSYPLYTMLLLPSTTKNSDLQAAVSAFMQLRPDSIVFTKLDETQTYGNIVNIIVKTGLPLSFLTSGQRVPEDIERASAKKIANLIMRGVL